MPPLISSLNRPVHVSSGAVVLRDGPDGREALLLYRAATDSWHLPKGTALAGEPLEEAARREVREESGYAAEIGSFLGTLPSTFERDGQTIRKETHYFLAKLIDTPPAAHDNEHDAVVFVALPAALERLERRSLYEREADILKAAIRRLAEA